ncbi:hypothetical protein DAEQUDRAFT_767885 [Daedalea quercina L-15889]|uniref:Protein kinase domain-containing protein n=1 Tax=Daedalea quercina L-15889 TaxID=1314783 RepID=A0A165N575_9APHY|nr:hypothetical protein DAEQUDRAFT_767885 [Daedalea quercina L-15889]
MSTAFTLADNHRRVAFDYLRPLKSGTPECAAFLAADDGDETRQYVVKFVERYGEEAHRRLADAGYAPQLLYYGDIWPEGAEQRGCGRHRMVVTDCIEGVSAADYDLDDEEGLGAIRAGVHRALEVLHAAGMVHGDIRRPNILIEAGEGSVAERVKIIDFDWAGVEGQVKYPLDLARNGWVHGVEELAEIKAAHNRGMVDRLS